MAITTDAAVEFFGTQDTVTGSTASVADGAFSVVSDVSTWTNDDDALSASVVLNVTFGTAPDANSAIGLFSSPKNIQGTSDQDAPTSSFKHTYLGAFPVRDVITSQYIQIDIALPNGKSSQEYDFFILNNAGQTISAGWNLYITPKAIGPHA